MISCLETKQKLNFFSDIFKDIQSLLLIHRAEYLFKN